MAVTFDFGPLTSLLVNRRPLASIPSELISLRLFGLTAAVRPKTLPLCKVDSRHGGSIVDSSLAPSRWLSTTAANDTLSRKMAVPRLLHRPEILTTYIHQHLQIWWLSPFHLPRHPDLRYSSRCPTFQYLLTNLRDDIDLSLYLHCYSFDSFINGS